MCLDESIKFKCEGGGKLVKGSLFNEDMSLHKAGVGGVVHKVTRHQILHCRVKPSFQPANGIEVFPVHKARRSWLQGKERVRRRELFLKLGYNHDVQFTAPPHVRVFCFKPNIVCCTSLDKDRVHHFAGAVWSYKPPEVYKGKGVLYIDEVKKLKPGKKQKK
uniref:Uncharacterized protein n=1 Tax=Avena sativa TaxID=4498 RepID=A0ACD6AD76_AVESA